MPSLWCLQPPRLITQRRLNRLTSNFFWLLTWFNPTCIPKTSSNKSTKFFYIFGGWRNQNLTRRPASLCSRLKVVAKWKILHSEWFPIKNNCFGLVQNNFITFNIFVSFCSIFPALIIPCFINQLTKPNQDKVLIHCLSSGHQSNQSLHQVSFNSF